MTIKAFLFDMDGTLLDTESLYTLASNTLLAEEGLGPLPWSVKVKLQGLPGLSATREFLKHFPSIKSSPEDWMARANAIQAKLWPTTQFLPGAKEVLEWAHSHKVPIALATSSHRFSYEVKTQNLREEFGYFGDHVITGDDPRIPPGRGKPAPDIWKAALASLNEGRKIPIKPEECLVFEDAVPGLKSGLAFGAGKVIWTPDTNVVSLYSESELEELMGDRAVCLKDLSEFKPQEYYGNNEQR